MKRIRDVFFRTGANCAPPEVAARPKIPASRRDDRVELLPIEELEQRLTPDHFSDSYGPPPPQRTVGWGC